MKQNKMKNFLNKLVATALTISLSCSYGIVSKKEVKADNGLIPTAYDNLKVSLRKKSQLVNLANGYMRVFYNEENIGIEYYDKNFNIQSRKTVSMELPMWGGFYAGKDNYYVVEGVSNTNEIDTAEVIRVIKYDKGWNRIGSASITGNSNLFGGEVRYPFDYGCVEMTEYNGKLFVVTGHQGYVDPALNQGHQGFLMISVDENTMKGEIVDCDLWHSFAQYIAEKDSNLYVLEQSEGSRYTKLTKYNADSLRAESIPLLEYGGEHTSVWSIACYASVDDLAVSADNVLCLGTSIDQSQYEVVNTNTAHNIYLTVTSQNEFDEENTQIKWLTNYKDDGSCFIGTQMTKINDNKFMISWEEYGKSQTAGTEDLLESSVLHYIFVDGNGNKISQEFTASAPISECHPIVDGSKIVYYASSSNMVDFYSIDINSGKMDKKIYRVAGQNATWKFDSSNGTLTISGSGAIDIDTEVHYRYPVSSASRGFSYSSSDNTWANIRDKVKKIVIQSGITSIPDNEFKNFDNLEEVEIGEGLQKIGDEAFYGCSNLKKITIPASVNSIGKSCFETGYFWIGSGKPVISVTIYTPENSYAAQYAKANGIQCQIVNKNVDKTKGKDKIAKAKINIKLSSKKKNTITVKWNKIANVKGYQVQYAMNRKFTKNKKIVKTNKHSMQIKKLKAGKKYFVRVRAYSITKGKKKYTKWSKVKSVKCK